VFDVCRLYAGWGMGRAVALGNQVDVTVKKISARGY